MSKKASDRIPGPLDNLPTLVWQCGVDAKCDYFNRAWLEFTGRSLDQEMGDGWTNGVHPQDLPGCLSEFLRAFHSRQPFCLEYRLRRHDGEYRWIVDQGKALYDPDGTFTGYVGSCFDVTERRIAEEALRKSEQRFTAIMENMRGFAWIKDADGRFVYLNQTAAQMSAYPNDWHGKTDFDLWPKLASNYQAGDKLVMDSRQALHTVEPVQGPSGAIGYVLASKFPIFDANGAVTQISGVGIDVTERKHSEEMLEKSKDQLRALTAKLQRVREEESIRLSREIHDELGHALTGLNMDLIWVQRRLEKEKSPLLRAHFQRRMKGMLASLETMTLTVQRIAAELRPGMLDDLGLGATLEWQAEEFGVRTGIRCEWKSTPSSVALGREQATALFRIFQEILSNVARHSAAQTVKLSLTQTNDELVLEVADDGKGFNKKKLVDHSSLGLLGMRERAALIGGCLHITTRSGKGTTVTVTCPIAPAKKSTNSKTRCSDE